MVDSTQTGFLPQRWIGDNILAHLETIDFHQHSQQPGVLLFLDFEKTFDRLDRPWMERCMAAVGFGAGAQRWVSLLHAGTTARVAFNGWHTARFPVQSGVFQGSPLSPLLYVLAVQPMAAHARQLAAQQGLHALSTPLGQPAPFMHCHADDTTIHAASPADAAAILAGSISLHCQATGARMQTAKSTGMGIGCLQHLTGPDVDTGITFSAAGSAITHLGIPLSTDPDAAARTLYTAILQRLDRRIARWSGFRLSLLGRAHVAKQVLVSMFTYHGTRRKGLVTRQSQAYPASAGGPSPHVSPRRHPRGVASLEGWSSGQDSILGSIRCGGTGLPQALGLFVSLPIRRAFARLVPSGYGTLPPREGGLHARLSHCIVHHAMAKQLPLS